MSKEKQIEEMARDLCYLSCTCEECPNVADWRKDTCRAKKYAERAYNAGYRKQSEGEWIKATKYSQEYCNKCGLTPKTIFGKLPPFCPNCGAKMKMKGDQ